jgi:hypothetical protein
VIVRVERLAGRSAPQLRLLFGHVGHRPGEHSADGDTGPGE